MASMVLPVLPNPPGEQLDGVIHQQVNGNALLKIAGVTP